MDAEYVDIEEIHQKYLADPVDETMSELVSASRGLILHYAGLYGGGYCLDDICQCGYEGLLKAVMNFDETRSVKFVTYASHVIIGEIRHYVRRERRYYYPQYLEAYQNKADNIISSNLDDPDRIISNDELADILNLKPESMPQVMGAGLVHLGDLETSNIKAKQMESFTLPVEDKLLLSQLMYHLTGIQKDVIEMLFHKEMTQEEVAKELGLTQKQVSRIKLRSLKKMRDEKPSVSSL